MKKRNLADVLAAAAIIIVLAAGFFLYNAYFLKEPKSIQLGNEAAILGSYVNETLLPAYLPQQLTVTHKLIDTGEAEGTNYTHGALWGIEGGKIYSFLHYTVNLTALSDLGIMVELEEAEVVDLNEATASELLGKYLSGSYAVKCDRGPNSIVICEDFAASRGVEQGAGVLTLPSANLTIVFSCKHFRKGELFGMGSCIKQG